jgi:amino acid adenylation domain-containing protein
MSEAHYEGVAIIGMAGKFPGAESIEEFWSNLVAGKESISFFGDAELIESGLDPSVLRQRGRYVPARGVLQNADCFDAAFFGIHPKEAEVMDPQQRVFLEICWAALERAGYAPSQIQEVVGVFAGATFNTYFLNALQRRPDLIELVGSEQVMFGNEKDYLTTRLAYKLGLRGPALNVSTACSTSLVAICQACQSLLNYQCDMALAGGVSITVPQKRGYFYDEGNIGSRDGHTRSFDAQAAGTVFSNGVGVVVLKRLEDAVKDSDQIFAVIKGAALNNDGSERVSFSAPGVEGQSKVVTMAHALAGIEPDTITYVEAHGTATPLGDPIEVAALTKAFRLGTDEKQFCALGSVKSNVGHLDVAAGVTGLIKTALSLHNKRIPASLHFTKPNPKLDLDNSPFYVNATLQEWKAKAEIPRRAGVSSFGTGGTNAHVILEEAPDLPESGPSSRPWQLLLMSAKTPEALERTTVNLSSHLQQIAKDTAQGRADTNLADAAFTLQIGRTQFTHRRIVVCGNAGDGAAALETLDPKRVFTHRQKLTEPPVVFMFPGQGAQFCGMGAALYRTEPLFRTEIDRCAEVLMPILKADLRPIMFCESAQGPEADLLVQTQFTQPALFAIEYSLAKLWESWGVRPAAMIGHSVGEYAAACLAGVFSLEDALMLVAQRGALVQAQPGGAMLSVRLPEKELLPFLNEDLALAAVNSPHLCVVSGGYDAVAALEHHLEERSISVRHLNTSHAFHSTMMDPVLEPFTELLRRVKIKAPQIPFISNVTAQWITEEECTSPSYWAGHVRQTVRFADGVGEILKDARNVLLEVGPGQTLTTLTRQHQAKSAEQIVLASLPIAGTDEGRGILETLGRLWMSGAPVDWQGFHANEHRRRVILPTYPFEPKRFWPDSAPMPAQVDVVANSAENNHENNGAAIANTDSGKSHVTQTTTAVPAPQQPQAALPRKERLMAGIRSLLEELSGYDLSEVDSTASLLELGLDSLLLTQAAQLLQRKFSVSITFRQLMEELGSIDEIASHLDATLPAEAFAPVTQAPVASSTAAPSVSAAGIPMNSALEQLLQQQQLLTNQLLQLLGRQPSIAQPVTPLLAAAPAPAKSEVKSHGPFKPIDKSVNAALSSKQRRALDALIDRYTRRTSASKQRTAENRSVLADPRSVAGFNRLWKEMVYPVVTTRSDGSKVWDVDGNEYVDFVMGFGASMFGHRPPFVVDAVHKQLDLGFEIGPIQPLAGEVAALVREFTGMPRVAFTNTGSEAVLAATRVSRTVTGRDKIAVFAGAYHGIFDEVLFRPLTVNGETRSAPIAPGVPGSAVGQVMVLEYGNPQSLEILRACGSEIAAVLVEPVQSRRLDLQPREFLHELRQITHQTGSALIFDEVVTGFRVHPGGAQAYFGVRADLATYGKVIGGGLPIGVVTGDSKYMDALDGGQWTYGDTSFPEVGVTFFAGTFVRHPLALAAAKAVLTHLKEKGPELQERLTERTRQAAEQLRAVIDEFHSPYHVAQFSSLIQLTFSSENKFAPLLFYMLRERGIHIWENRAFVITTTHSEEDFGKLISAVRQSLAEMQSAEFLPLPSKEGNKTPHASAFPDTTALKGNAVSQAEPNAPIGKFPLTEPQKEVWLAAQMGGDAALAYNESLSLDLRGSFDVEVFRAAASQVIQRHPILLAHMSPDGQWQEINFETKVEMPLIKVRGGDEPEGEAELKATIDEEVSFTFDLVKGPLLRVRIIRLSEQHHVVIWTAHHIICDGWSAGLLLSELAKIYSALKQGTAPSLDVPVSFLDYARATQSDAGEAQALGYWRRQFADVPPVLDLPTDRARSLVRSASASTTKRRIATSVQGAIKRTASQQRTTQVVLLMAALKTLLYRLTGQTDVVVGLGVAGQAVRGENCLVGHCVNLLPVRTRLEPEASFLQNLTAVKKNVLDALEHHQCTLGSILQHTSVPRIPGRSPLVEVIFNVDRDPGAEQFEGLEFSCDRNPKRALHFDLFFNFVDGPRGLLLECDFNTELFDVTTIERWLGHYETLLANIAATPERPLAQVPILTEGERRELIYDRNKRDLEFPGKDTLHVWFERQVERTPDACALTFEGRHLTYKELNGRANQLAHYLRAVGAGPDVLIGLFVERSVDMVVGILGILKSGAAYVPIDPIYPQDRVTFILEDAKVPVLLTHSTLAPNLTSQATKIICLDVDMPLFSGAPETNPPHASGPDSLAYVIYTSGSTGRPKGTLVTHHNVVRLMQATEGWFKFNERDVWTFFHSHAFDFSVWELWGALLYGGRVVIVPYLTSRSPDDFYKLLVGEQVTVLNQTPSAFRQLIQVDAATDVRDKLALRYVIFGGEALEIGMLKPWFDRHGDRHPVLVNMYGITETTVHVTYRPLSAADLSSGSLIGVPIPDLQLYILDSYLQPVPCGVIGEICVGGAGVSRGYLKREELTRQKFIEDPYSSKPGTYLYRSGDLARYVSHGDIEYLGRLDDQIKIRGFRIELGEIEAVLSRQPEINQCMVVAFQDGTGDKRLVAYLETRRGSTISQSELRSVLKKELPDYMVPSTFILVDEFPLTANGKIDRKALPPPESVIKADGDYVSPRDSVEQALCRIWSKLLRVKRVGIHDNFFELGGHSLLAVRLIADIEKIYNKRLPLATLIQFPTVAQIGEVLRRENWRPSWSSLVPLQPGGSRPPLFIMHSHGGNVLEHYPLANHMGFDQPIYALQARGLDGHVTPDQTMKKIAEAYIEEIRSLQPEGPYYVGGFCFGGLLALEVAQQLSHAGEEVALVAMIQTIHPAAARFRPDTNPLQRWWYRAVKRIDLERENLVYRGKSYISERVRRVWNTVSARTQIAFDKIVGKGPMVNGGIRRKQPSLEYILEVLGAEHDRVFEEYEPRPYEGRVVVFRAKKQLQGLAADWSLGWKSILNGSLEVCEVPGHQQNMLIEPNVSRLAEELTVRLETTQSAAKEDVYAL